MNNTRIHLTREEISNYLDITTPFLMIDKAVDVIPGKTATGVKILSEKEWFFNCHLHKDKVMPGTLQIESMLQTLVLTLYTLDGHYGKYSYITAVETKLISKIYPGYPLIINAELISFKRGVGKGLASGMINNSIVCHGSFTLVSPHLLIKKSK